MSAEEAMALAFQALGAQAAAADLLAGALSRADDEDGQRAVNRQAARYREAYRVLRGAL